MEKTILDIITIIVLGSWVVIHIRYIHKMEQEIETQNNLIESQKELVNALFKVWARERRGNAESYNHTHDHKHSNQHSGMADSGADKE